MKTHYDVLNVDKNCSAKEIKDSFIKLSKKYHPDKNKSSDAHKKFVEVNEAYSVLGKSSSRCMYDETLSRERRVEAHTTSTYKPGTTYTTRSPYEYYAEMYARNIQRNPRTSQGYYTNSRLTAVWACLMLLIIGSGIQILAESQRRYRRSHQIAVMLKEAREKSFRRELRLKQQAMSKNESSNLNPGEQ